MTDDASSRDDPFVGPPGDTRERIMQATFRILQEHGFAGLSIGRIAEEADLSKSSVYHFFEDKNDLLLSFLDAMLAHFGPPLADRQSTDPEAALRAHVDFALAGVSSDRFPPVDSDEIDPGSGRPYVELRSQAVHDEAYRDRFTDLDASLRDRLAAVVRDGIDRGAFREVDPEATAEFLITVMLGGLFRRATADGMDVEAVRNELDAVVRNRLLRED
jgi:AcrR family transcriptional regulator